MAGGLVKSWSSTQKCIALSVGEAEYVACAKAAAEGLHLASLLSDLGVPGVRVKVCVDSSTAKSLAERSGLGGARHMDIRLLWLQACVKKGEVSIQTVIGTENPADALTKPLGHEALELAARRLNGYFPPVRLRPR